MCIKSRKVDMLTDLIEINFLLLTYFWFDESTTKSSLQR